MEHQVKRRSDEWRRLQKTVTLTASKFAEAVGLGRETPFAFFQSLVEKSNAEGQNGVDVSPEYIEKRVEKVMKEAYELLTGLRIQESGFWVPERDSPMSGLIGSSPDGLVVDAADTTRVLGLAAFKAPENDMYSSWVGSKGDIPRHYMVQVQGQMAVCGAPWCDFMAVCSKTREIMLRRIFFQPRYWEHVSSRIRQFCFALQEAEIMRELGRDLASGLMARRLQQQSVQTQPLPAEDVITVQNLLTNTGRGTFRGPSRKLLSFDILVGDVYPLPPTLSKYSQELLARVDAEIQRKTPAKVRLGIEENARDESVEHICRRVFYGDAFVAEEEREPESSEEVFGEGLGMFDDADEDVDVVEEFSITEDSTEGSVPPVPDTQVESVSGEGDSSEHSARQDVVTKTPSASAESVGVKRPFRGRGAQNTNASGRGVGGSSAGRGGNVLGTAAGGDAKTSGTPATQALRGRGRGRGLASNQSRNTAPARGQPASVSTPSGTGKTQPAKSQPGHKTQTESPVPRKIPRLSATVRTGQAGTATKPQPKPSATTVNTSSSPIKPRTTAVGSASRMTGQSTGSARGDSVAQKEVNVSPAKISSSAASSHVAGRSAKAEWEMSAKTRPQRTQPPQRLPSQSEEQSEQVGEARTPDRDSSHSRQIDSTLTAARQNSPAVSASVASGSESAGGTSGDDKLEDVVAGEKDGDQWRVEVLSSGNDFVPPGLTLLGSGESEVGETSDVSPAKDTSGGETAKEATSEREESTDEKSDSASSQQSLKRSLTERDSSTEVAVKKASISRPAASKTVDEPAATSAAPSAATSVATSVATLVAPSTSGKFVPRDPESPTKSQIHRPWLQRQDRGDQRPHRDQDHGDGPFRDRPFDKGPERLPRLLDNRDEGRLSRSWGDRQDVGFHPGNPFHDRGGAPPIRSVLDIDFGRGGPPGRQQFEQNFDRDGDQGRVFDYDHQRRIRAEDFHRRPNLAGSQPSGLRQGVLQDHRGRDFDRMHRGIGGPSSQAGLRGPQDLSLGASRGPDGGMGLDRGMGGGAGVFGGRGLQLQGRWPESDTVRGLALRPAHTNLPVGVRDFPGMSRAFNVPAHLVDRNFPGHEARDTRPEWERAPLRGPAGDFRRDMGRGQGFPHFPPGRRPFEF